jgi:hypothetical protein
MRRTSMLIALLALTPLAAAANTATLQFETEALDLETGAVTEVLAALPQSLDADFYFAYHAGRTPHAVLFPNDLSGVEISFLDDTPYNLISEVDIPLLTFTVEFPDQPFDNGDTAVLRTDTGACYKVGNAVEDELSVQFDYQLLTEQSAAIDSLQTAPRPALARPLATPNGLPAEDWEEIRSSIEGDLYRIADLDGHDESSSRTPGAQNPRHRLLTTFTQSSVRIAPLDTARDSWTWSLALESYGYGKQLLTPEKPEIVTDGNRIEYRRGRLTEWYVNDERGLEQGFTLSKPPPGHGKHPLLIRLELGGSLAAEPSLNEDEILLAKAGSNHQLRYGGLMAWDATSREFPARMILEGQTLTLEVDDRGAVYPLTVDPTVEYLSKFLPTDGLRYSLLGYSVSVSGDTVLVGAPNTSIRDPSNPVYSFGVAYVFVNENGVWTQQARLEASDFAAHDFFGSSVSVWGDTALIGAVVGDGAMTNTGAAYLFVRSGETWTEQAKLTASDGWSGDQFGISVSLWGDTALVGANGDDGQYSKWAGAAYVFVRESGLWTEQAKLPRFCEGWCFFGGAVSISEDTALVAYTTTGMYVWGRVRAYVRNGGVWSHQQELEPNETRPAWYGFSVSLSGDTALVGAAGDNDNGYDSGSVYVFVRSSGTWAQQAKLLPSDGGLVHGYFGCAVSISGDTAVVGASTLRYSTGSAYLFERNGTEWTEQSKFLAADGSPGNDFGRSVAISGSTLAIGSPWVVFWPNAGALYTYGLLTNEPPVCGSPAFVDVECDGPMTTVVGLDGTTSSDPDDDPLSFSWTTDCPGGSFDDATSATPVLTIESTTGVCAPLSCSATLTVSDDGGESNTCPPSAIQVHDSLPPILALEASPSTLECGVDSYIEAGASASDVCDPDVDVVIGGDPVDTGVVGSYTKTYDAADDCGNPAAQATREVSVVDTLPPTLTPAPSPATLECGIDTYSEAGAVFSDICDSDASIAIGGDTVNTGSVGSYTKTYDAADASGNAAVQATRTVTVIDTLPPTLVVQEPTAITVTDLDCSGDEPALLPTASAADACDPDVPVSSDAPASFPAGATTTVTYTAVDDSGNPSTAGVDVTVVFGANTTVQARRHIVGPGTYPGANKEPIAGVDVCAYDKSETGCARATCGGVSHHQYQCILDTCAPVNADFDAACCTTSVDGQCTIFGPPGEYLFISGDPTGTILPNPLGGAGELSCGVPKKKYLQQIVRADGKKIPGKSTIRTGSELLIIEPEFVEWDEAQESYPVVFDSVGEWSAEAAVAPPEGFVSDYDSLAEHVENELEAVQFLLTDVGSDWVPTETRYTLEHQGRTEVVLSRIGVRLSERLAEAKGLDRSGRPLAADGMPRAQRGFDPRGEWPAEIVGWIEPSSENPTWTVKLSVSRATDLEILLRRGEAHVVGELAQGFFEPGEYAFTWSAAAAEPGPYFLSLTADDLFQTVKLADLPR